MSMNICITIYWESGVTGGQQTFGDLEKTDIYCSVRVEFPRELCGRMEDGEWDVAIERRTDEGEDDCDRGYQD